MIVPINGVNVYMNLVPSTDDILSPNFAHVHQDHSNKTVHLEPHAKHCHYKSITANVYAAISNCDKFYVSDKFETEHCLNLLFLEGANYSR